MKAEEKETIVKRLWNANHADEIRGILNEYDKLTTTPQANMSAREYYDKRLSEDSTIGTVQLLEEYRNLPAKFTPERTAREEAERLYNQFDDNYEPICTLNYTINALQLRGLDTTYEESVLNILKGM